MSRTVKTVLKISFCLVLAVVMCFSAYQIQKTQGQYEQEELLHQTLLVYKPVSVSAKQTVSIEATEPDVQGEPDEPGAVALLREQYPDVIGWITIPGTRIDYPFVQAEDNDKYLRTDINGNYLSAGSIFLDYRSAPDFSLFNSVIYGHNMKNSSMFGTLPGFRNEGTFNQLTDGTVFLEDIEYRFEIFACLLTNNYDSIVYSSLQSTDADKQAFLDYIAKNASRYRDIGVGTDDHLLTLSTCSYEFADARTVIVGRLAEITPQSYSGL